MIGPFIGHLGDLEGEQPHLGDLRSPWMILQVVKIQGTITNIPPPEQKERHPQKCEWEGRVCTKSC